MRNGYLTKHKNINKGEINMKLLEELNQLSKYSGKSTYEDLVNKIKEVAKKGEYEIYIDMSEVFREDIEKLDNEGIKVVEEWACNSDNDYTNTSFYILSWKEEE